MTQFSTKASTLDFLSDKLQAASILSLAYFTVKEWRANKQKCLQEMHRKLGEEGPWVVRSSCRSEDTLTSSKAGAYLSVLNVSTDELEKSTEQVINSYDDSCPDNQVLIQPMLENVLFSGVGFSHDPNTSAPYRVISWSEGGDTSTITSGKCGNTWYQAALSPVKPPENIKSVFVLMKELLAIFDEEPIDFEFAISQEKGELVLWLLQVRPLVVLDAIESNEKQAQRLQLIHAAIEIEMKEHPFLQGKKTLFAVMSDWNPAEIIGIRPRTLSLSLYRELITDAIWAYQRNNYGYRNLRSFPLMKDFYGVPYIDLRVSFNSFIPAGLDEKLAKKLANYYIKKLSDCPVLHDKIEFDVVFSCFTFNLSNSLDLLLEHDFSLNDIKAIENNLLSLTNRIIKKNNSLLKNDTEKLDVLLSRRQQLYGSNLTQIDKIYWLIEDTKRYGTLPFAGLARAGFVAMQMLKSLVSLGVLSPDDFDCFLSSVSTINSKMLYEKNTLSKIEFLNKYGHLRPGTYNILSPRYDEQPNFYFDWDESAKKPTPKKKFSLSIEQMREISALLVSKGLDVDVVGLFDFFYNAIEMRELSKFYFTKNLSDVLYLTGQYGECYGFSKEDLSFCDISVFKDIYVSKTDPKIKLGISIEQGKAKHEECSKLSLPPVIVNPDDVWGYMMPKSLPNFITQKAATGLVTNANARESLSGAIVCIPNADPGYDWIFSCNISGLITAWGGVNSHMAIRAGEMAIPAVIGCGQRLYEQWSKAKRIRINCSTRVVEELV